MTHALLPLLLAAADGRFPAEDGGVTWLPAPAPGLAAAVAFTAHAVICADIEPFDDPPVDGYGSVHRPDVLLRLAGGLENPIVGVLDGTLVSRGLGGGALPRVHDLDDHPRVRHARAIRTDVRVHADPRGLVTVAQGLAGRTELSVELADPSAAPAGVGRSLIVEALKLVPEGDPVFAAVAPGNTRSLRAFLALGFTPVGSEVILHSGQREPRPGTMSSRA
ncbi:hypothetical protein [Jatrophihabitans fulvus]